tara:strand:- start:1616 stop:2032 length:417 start_codon:yes stop_codon:yes gene_type:complete
MGTRNNIWSGYKKLTPIKSKTKNKQPEYELQKAICQYLGYKYPTIFYNGSAGGMRTFLSVAKRMKATGYQSGFPDLFIYESRNGFHGLAIELKVKGNYASPKQKEVLSTLQKKGYRAEVCTGFDHASRVIDEYLSKSE